MGKDGILKGVNPPEKSPAHPAQSSKSQQGAIEYGQGSYSQLRNVTMNPIEYPAVTTLLFFTM
jgi:hypothetical protein